MSESDKTYHSQILDGEMKDLASEILGECRVSLMMAYRFLDAALWKMPFINGSFSRTLSTDGISAGFEALSTILRFKTDANELIRDYLHMILHCILRHPFVDDRSDGASWWLSCDIATEAICIEIAARRFPSQHDQQRLEELEALRSQLGELNAFRLYRAISGSRQDQALRDRYGLYEPKLWDLEQLFTRDDHSRWKIGLDDEDAVDEESLKQTESPHATEDPAHHCEDCFDSCAKTGFTSNMGSPINADSTSDADSATDASSATNAGPVIDIDSATSASSLDDDAYGASDADGSQEDENLQLWKLSLKEDLSQAQEAWEEISRQVEMDLESFSKGWGSQAGSFVANLRLANRKQINYGDFLRRFAAPSEEMKIDDDSFDYIFYNYGLEHYGNMPLVEPLEYVENHSVREFVIAIDTSQSCSGELVTMFLEKTFEILHDTGTFGSRINVHIVQCDAEIQTDTKITSPADLERYTTSFEVRGFGGTDFRPVFEYVEKLVDEGEFEDLSGLVYFTDGFGTFPEKMPSFKTAFVFMDDGVKSTRVPPWAMKVLIDEDTLRKVK